MIHTCIHTFTVYDKLAWRGTSGVRQAEDHGAIAVDSDTSYVDNNL